MPAKAAVQFSSGYSAYSVCGPAGQDLLRALPSRFGSERNPQYRPEDPNMGVPKREDNCRSAQAPGLQLEDYWQMASWHLQRDPPST